MLLLHVSGAISAMVLVGQSLGATVPSSSNTTALKLFGASGSQADGDISIQSGCDQGNCPDPDHQKEGWDFMQIITPYIPRVGIRVDRCRECSVYIIGYSGDGCAKFKNCEWSETQEICADVGNMRAHWYGPGGKVCYSFTLNTHEGCVARDGYPAIARVFSPTKVECTW
ncbi:hypothetical protein DL769_002806 [Monosporascus sp. CRB-8-3]|nr:hypothetical protein DL769_002806 [Monosporascus sp. CRB-8-3]